MGRGKADRFTSLSVKTAKLGNHPDGGNLYLRVRPDGSRSWAFRFKRGGKQHWMSLGPVRDVTLSEAREIARNLRNQIRSGYNPLEQRRERQAAALTESGRMFDAVAKLYIEEHKAGWRSDKHSIQWLSTLNTYASPVVGSMSVGAIGLDEILRILRPIWKIKPETASRLRGRVEAVLDFAAVHGYRKGDNPARWSGFLDQVLPAKSKIRAVVHHAAIPYTDMPAIMNKLASSPGTGARCLRFLILTAARSGEARGALWPEIDLEAATWTIPGSRMKGKLQHKVPLAGPALAILKGLKAQGALDGLVFPGGKPGRPLSDVAVSKTLATAAAGFTVHGCRSSFRDWVAEKTVYPREVAEAALAHTNKDKVEAAYRRSDLFDQRARLMRDWNQFATTTAGASGKGV